MEERELLLERLELALDRIREIPGEDWQEESLQHWKEYFTAVAKFLLLIESNPQHPSLRTKKIQGTDAIFEASITMGIRVTFQYIKPDTIYLRNVGEHNKTLKRN